MFYSVVSSLMISIMLQGSSVLSTVQNHRHKKAEINSAFLLVLNLL